MVFGSKIAAYYLWISNVSFNSVELNLDIMKYPGNKDAETTDNQPWAKSKLSKSANI